MAKSIMIQGTASNSGKSVVTAAFCRIFMQDGYRTAPFKSQNMALNSYITKDGLEMGRAQAVQAEAAGVEPSELMNPILLKPTGEATSQVIVYGKVTETIGAKEYFQMKKSLVPLVLDAYNYLAERHDVIVIEGAGSPAEINLKAEDIVNMGLAELVDAPVLLVGDIDRGGVFASIYGTIMLLEEHERKRIKGIIINKFRGDVGLLMPGLKRLEELTGIPVVGVIPHLDLDIDDEDSMSLRLQSGSNVKPIDIAVINLPKISNFTDFAPLERNPNIGVRYVQTPKELGRPDMVILPGTENVVADLLWMRQNGLEAAVKKLADAGILVFGLGGGYQMLGESIDPQCPKYSERIQGMGLLPIKATFTQDSTAARVSGRIKNIEGPLSFLSGAQFEGYEIKMGETVLTDETRRLFEDDNKSTARSCGAFSANVWGSIVHGLFDNGKIADRLAVHFFGKIQVPRLGYHEQRQREYDKLASAIRSSLDMDMLYRILQRDV